MVMAENFMGMTGEAKGLLKANEICKDRPRRVKQLKALGKKVIGYICIYPPLEMFTALDLVPYRIFGDTREPITKADSCLPTVVCPFLRSALDLGLKNKYDFLDGVVIGHACETCEKSAHIWRIYLDLPYSFFIDTPHGKRKAALQYHKKSLEDFRKSLESFAGGELSTEKLREAIKVHNQQRALVRELYELKKADPPLISGEETLQVMKSLMSIPPEEGNELLEEIMSEVKKREDGLKKGKRLLIWGSIIDDTALIKVIEEAGANVVMDDTCVGSRFFFPDVKTTSDPLDGLAHRYLADLKCPRTFVENVSGETRKDYMTDLETRFGYLRGYIEEWNIDGIILYGLRYCDIHGYEVPSIKDYLESLGLRSIHLEHDYSEAALAPLRTRVQALLEVLK